MRRHTRRCAVLAPGDLAGHGRTLVPRAGLPGRQHERDRKGSGDRGSRSVPHVLVQTGDPRCAHPSPRRVVEPRDHSRTAGRSRPCRNACANSSRAGSGSALTTPISSPFRSPNCRTPPAKFETATRETRPTARGCGSTWSASWSRQTTVAEGRLLVAAAISFIDDAVRTWHLTRYAGVADEMTAIVLSILTSRNSPQR